MKPRGRQPDHCDWKPLAVPEGYRENYDNIKWISLEDMKEKYPSIETEEVPIHVDCGGECDALPYEEFQFDLERYKCRKCGFIIYDEPGRIEWK